MNQEIKDMEGNVIAQLERPDRAETLSEKVFENEWFQIKLGGWSALTSFFGWCRCASHVFDVSFIDIYAPGGWKEGAILCDLFTLLKNGEFSIKETKDGIKISGTQTFPYCDKNCNPQISNNHLTIQLRNWTPIIEIGIEPEITYLPAMTLFPLPIEGGYVKSNAYLYDGKDLTPYEIINDRIPSVDIASGMAGVVMNRNGGKATIGVMADIGYSESPFQYYFDTSIIHTISSRVCVFAAKLNEWFNTVCSNKATYYILYNPLEASTDELIRGYNDVLKIKGVEKPLLCLPSIWKFPEICLYKPFKFPISIR